jgi:TRAP-type mannitol/chloroaromatic compound transport system substrate-binding protein
MRRSARLATRASVPTLVAAVVAGAAMLTSAPAAAQPVKLKVQSGFPLSAPVLGEMVQHFADLVAASGRDDLTVRLYDAGKLVPPLQIFDAVAAGKIEAGFAWPGYWMGKLPAVTVFAAVPFGPGPDEFLAWIQQGGGLELWRELYAPLGVVPVPCGILPPEASGWFARPIDSAEDLKGLKIRYAGLGGKVLEKLGASITMLAAGDLFLALERGVLDATEYSMPAVDRSLGFHKVVKHYYFPGWHQPASIMELAVNARDWEALGPERRHFLATTCQANILWSLTRGVALQGEALAFFEANGVTIHTWSPALMRRFREAAGEVMAEAAEADPDFARAWRSQREFLASTAPWTAIAAPD